MKQIAALLLVLLGASGTTSLGGQVAVRECDRACLHGFLTQYLNALVVNRPSVLSVAANVRFTEDTKEMKLGEGLWKNASSIRTYRQEILDVRQGVAGAHVVVEEGGSPVMLVLRLKVVARQITEIETQVTRNQREGLIFDVDALQTPSKTMTLVPERAQLNSRAEAIKIAERYPAGLRAGSFVTVDVPFASDAYRFEAGRLMAGPGCTFIPGCENIKTQRIPTLPETAARVAAVDEELGIVWLRMNFGKGSVPDAGSTLVVWEAFKVYSGQIHAVEAFMKMGPLGAPSGWD